MNIRHPWNSTTADNLLFTLNEGQNLLHHHSQHRILLILLVHMLNPTASMWQGIMARANQDHGLHPSQCRFMELTPIYTETTSTLPPKIRTQTLTLAKKSKWFTVPTPNINPWSHSTVLVYRTALGRCRWWETLWWTRGHPSTNCLSDIELAKMVGFCQNGIGSYEFNKLILLVVCIQCIPNWSCVELMRRGVLMNVEYF